MSKRHQCVWLAIIVLSTGVAACRTLPDVGEASNAAFKAHPTVASASGPLPTNQAKELLARRWA